MSRKRTESAHEWNQQHMLLLVTWLNACVDGQVLWLGRGCLGDERAAGRRWLRDGFSVSDWQRKLFVFNGNLSRLAEGLAASKKLTTKVGRGRQSERESLYLAGGRSQAQSLVPPVERMR